MPRSKDSEYELTLKPVKESRVPSFDRILDRARTLTAASTAWTPGKPVGDIQTFSLKAETSRKGPRWWARVSRHRSNEGRSGFDLLWTIFSKNRFEHEKRYNPNLLNATYLKTVQWGEVWALQYSLPPPFSPRTRTLLTATFLENVTPRIAWVLSIPFEIDQSDVALSLFVEEGVSSKVVKIERIRELEGGVAEWLVCTSSDPGGAIPLWLSEQFHLKRSTSVVPRVDEYLTRKPEEKESSKASKTAKRRPRPTPTSSSTSIDDEAKGDAGRRSSLRVRIAEGRLSRIISENSPTTPTPTTPAPVRAALTGQNDAEASSSGTKPA